MKKILFFIACVACYSSIYGQKISSENVPAAVTNAFKAKFSIAEKTTWEMDYDNYEANFSVGKSEFSCKFDKDGKWIETITYLKPSELPKVIKDALSAKYGEVLSAYKIDDPIKVEKEKATVYKMDITKGENEYELTFDDAGELLEDEIKTSIKKEN